MVNLLEIYNQLLNYYGRQNWWPIKYNFKPKEWEICVGAILTQNTNWNNVEKALKSLKENNCITIKGLLTIKKEKLEKIIRSSGFYKQKAERLKLLAKLISEYGSFKKFINTVKREDLLKVKGIGKETADSILLYVCNKKYFIIDTYTKKLCEKFNLIKNNYEDYRLFFENNLPKDIGIYKEFHALIVSSGKENFKNLF